MIKPAQFKSFHIFAILSLLLIIGCFGTVSFARSTFYVPCKKLPEGVTRKDVEANFEKYRTDELRIFMTGYLTCEEAFPVLKKYALDPDPRIREIVTQALAMAYYSFEKSFYPKVFKLLLRQVERFPLYKGGFPTYYASFYPCYRFRKIDGKPLAQSLITRIKSREAAAGFDEIELLSRDEIYLLGCLSKREKKAKDFLAELWQPDYPTRLNEEDRQYRRKMIFSALAESGLKAAEDEVLAEIEKMTATADVDKIASILDVKSYTGCRILKRYISLLTDKREVGEEVYRNGEIKHLTGRVGDLAIPAFISVYGIEGTGERDVSFHAHSDAEMETFYRRVKSYVRKKVAGSCDFEK
jgi:hypothetical protein